MPKHENSPGDFDPQDPSSPPQAPGLGQILRALFQAGASDEVVSRFVPLYQNMAGGQPQPPMVDLGPAITEAARAAGTEVARGLLSQMNAASDGSQDDRKTFVANPTFPAAPQPAQPSRPVRPAKQEAAAATSADAMVNGQIYRFNVAGRRTSVSLPPELLQAARDALGAPKLKEVVQQLYSQVPLRKSNRSAFVREGLREQIAASARAIQIDDAQSGASSGPLH